MSEHTILYELKNYHTVLLSGKAISVLKKLKGDNLLSPDDHDLKNVWEEICVQKQAEESVFWNTYEETIEMVILDILSRIDKEILKFLSIMDDEEYEQIENGNFNYDDYNHSIDSVLRVLKNHVIQESINYSNRRIQNYLDNHC